LSLKRIIIYSLFSSVLFSSLGLVFNEQAGLWNQIGLVLGFILAFSYQVLGLSWNRWWFNLLALLALAFALVYGIWFAKDPIQVIIYFLGYLLLIRMFELESARDQKLALLLSLFEITAGSLLTYQLRYFIFFLAWLICSIFSLSLITISNHQLNQSKAQGVKLLFAFVSSAGVLCLVFGFLIFFILPRVGYSLFNLSFDSNRAWSGYSSTITLGEVNKILLNQTPVMRVHIKNYAQPIPKIKWRMKAMDYFENNTWEDHLGVNTNFINYFNRPVTINPKPPPGEEIVQEIYLEPGIGPELASAGFAYAYLLPYQFQYFLCYFNDYCALPILPSERTQYLAYSLIPEYSEPEINQTLSSIPNLIKEKNQRWLLAFLELPSGSESICELAQKITEKEQTPFQKIVALASFFQTDFQYSLENLPSGPNPIEQFLFNHKKGNCEYFATADALMLRCLGIPSRLVAGFLSGEWNQAQHYYLVRESHAHTWVEVVLPGLGFIEVDPTPIPAQLELTKTSFWAEHFDSLIFLWNRWILEFSIQDQIRGLRKIQAQGMRFSYSLQTPIREINARIKATPIAGMLLISALIAIGAWLLKLKPKKKTSWRELKKFAPDQRRVIKFYLKMLGHLKKKGLEIKPSSTGLELAQKPNLLPEARKALEKITRFYYQLRFGNKKPKPQEWTEMESELNSLKKLI